MRTALEEAVRQWNNTSGTNLRFRYVNDGQDVYVQGSNSIPGTGRANLPNGQGRPGKNIWMNTTLNRSWSKWVNTTMHELGHTVGLHHTNQKDKGSHIEGTEDGDKYSIMWSSANNRQNRFSYWDKIAVQKLYGGCN